MRPVLLLFIALICAAALGPGLAPTPAMAQRAIEGANPHPAVPLPPGGIITRDEFTDFAILELPTGRFVRGEDRPQMTAEGAHTRLEYTIEGLETSSLRLYRSYLDYLQGQGFTILYSGIGDEIADRRSVDFLLGTILAASPSSSSEVAYVLAQNPARDQLVALSIYQRQSDRRLMVNVVDLQDMAPLDLLAPDPASEAAPEPEPAADAAAPVQPDVAGLETGLLSDGRVVVDAILFEFDEAKILPESAQALATVAELMTGRPGLSLLVVGHTDGVGEFDYNLRLSVDRATAVVDWLRGRHGIESGRLRAAGAGPMSPITTNRTEAGRALNRRVELVEMIE